MGDRRAEKGIALWLGRRGTREVADVPVQQQVNELGLIRQSLYELETMHNKARTE
jgi:hypothetical protein